MSPALLSNLGGAADAEFAAQFTAVHAGGPPIALLLNLHPGLHHQHAADTVAELLAVRGVAMARWIRASPHGEALIDDRVRAVLAGFTVKTTRQIGGTPLICLHHEATGTVLVTAHPGPGEGDSVNQDTLHLGEVVAQAMRHHAEAGGHDEQTCLPEPQPALRCNGCHRIIGAGQDLEALDLCAGAVCGQANLSTGRVCGGVFEAVSVLVTRRAPRVPA